MLYSLNTIPLLSVKIDIFFAIAFTKRCNCCKGRVELRVWLQTIRRKHFQTENCGLNTIQSNLIHTLGNIDSFYYILYPFWYIYVSISILILLRSLKTKVIIYIDIRITVFDLNFIPIFIRFLTYTMSFL